MTGFDLSTAQGIYIGDQLASAVYLGNNLIWTGTHDYSQDYLTFEAIENTTFKLIWASNTLQYSIDGGSTWTTLAADTASPTVTAGNKIMWKQTGLTPARYVGIGTFSSTGNYKAYGNIMSLYYGDNFVGQTNLTGKNYAFYGLFYNNKLVDASNLILPATTLAEHCYEYMFYGCTSLTTAPELPATTLAQSCYYYMFHSCTSLTTAPELLVTTLIQSCYYGMFQGCTSLNYIKCLATNISATSCTAYWVNNVAATGTFVKADSMSSWNTGTNGIPSGWTVQNV